MSAVSAGLVHFVIPLPIEFDGVAVTGSSKYPGPFGGCEDINSLPGFRHVLDTKR
jgi:hypothetical protein